MAASNGLLTDVRAMGSALLSSRKSAGAERLAGLAEAAQTLSASLEDAPVLQHYAGSASSALEELSDYVERTDLDDIFEDTMKLARNQPILTLALAVAGGVMITQMVRNWRDVSLYANGYDKPKRRSGRASNGRAKRRNA